MIEIGRKKNRERVGGIDGEGREIEKCREKERGKRDMREGER